MQVIILNVSHNVDFFFFNLDHSHPFYIITIQSCKTKVQQRLLDTVYRWCVSLSLPFVFCYCAFYKLLHL